MTIKHLSLLMLFIFSLQMIAFNQSQTKRERLLKNGYCYLNGDCHKEKKNAAKKSFKRAKRFSLNKDYRKLAKRGLAEYYLSQEDSVRALKILRRIVGKSICNKIESSEFSKLQQEEKNDWNIYYSTAIIIQIKMANQEDDLVQNYFTYLIDYIPVIWSGGSGSMEHDIFLKNVNDYLKI